MVKTDVVVTCNAKVFKVPTSSTLIVTWGVDRFLGGAGGYWIVLLVFEMLIGKKESHYC